MTPSYEALRELVEAAAGAFAKHGVDYAMPWDGDLDDWECEKFSALEDAVTSVIDGVAEYLERQPSFGDGKWAAAHVRALLRAKLQEKEG